MGIYKTSGLTLPSNSVDHISQFIAFANEQLITIPWLETCFGEAERRRVNDSLEPFVYIAQNEGTATPKGSYYAVRPTRQFGTSFSFFNPAIEEVIDSSSGFKNYLAATTYELIVFSNHKAINPNKGSRFERELARQVQEKLSLTMGNTVVFSGVSTVFSDVYDGYDLDVWQEALTQERYSAFKITFTNTAMTPCYTI